MISSAHRSIPPGRALHQSTAYSVPKNGGKPSNRDAFQSMSCAAESQRFTCHNDYPEFEVDDGQSRTSWTRQGPDEEYVVGRTIQIEYILQRFKEGDKKLRKMLGEHSRCVLRITLTDENVD